jgi:hypothetical protein
MNELRKLTTNQRALAVNLDPGIYGTFAEIGAGQDVAANFFKAGGASGTIAKSMSAYDMAFSDAIYGADARYVCEARLLKMLDHEYDLLTERLPHKADDSKFFAFANTMEALNYKRTNQAQGWIGIRFMTRPTGPYNECIMHVLMHDNDAVLQQQAIGVIGVNLIFSCCYLVKDEEEMLLSIMDGLNPGRIEIDMFKLVGPDFEDVDNRLLSLKLVKSGFTEAAMFGPDGHALQPSEALYKKNVLMLRGRFRPVTVVNVDMLLAARRQFINEPDVNKDKIVVLTELTLTNLETDGAIDEEDFLNRVDIICALGQTVMISNYRQYYKLVDYLSDVNRGRKIGIILGIGNLHQVFDEQYYTDLRGGVLEAFGTLFGNNVTLYVYPSIDSEGQLYPLEKFKLPKKQQALFQFLLDNKKLVNVEKPNYEHLNIMSDDVLDMIQAGDEKWEKLVPRQVVRMIKERRLFDYPGSESSVNT